MVYPWKTFVVKDDERAILTKDGRMLRMLEPGRYNLADPRNALAIETFRVAQAEFPAERHTVLSRTLPEAAALFERIETRADEVAIVLLDRQPRHLVGPNATRVFWKAVTEVEVIRVDTAADARVAPEQLKLLDATRSSLVLWAAIEAHEAGLLFVDGALVEVLTPGRHAFWMVNRVVRVLKLDLRPQPVEITAQEILTKDKVGLRVTLTAFYRIADPVKVAAGSVDVAATLYRLVQFAVREAIASRTLDEILSARERIDEDVRAFVNARSDELGIAMGELGVKDVILPGEVRDLVNKVVEAERVAKANLIRRQEETAATRSLLNTAKLMEDNPLLLRLKELESLERLVEKVGRVDLHASDGQGLEAMLKGLFRFDDKAA